MSLESSQTQIEAFPLWREVGVRLFNLGKRYNREWIFTHINYNFEAGKKYAITGSNGSGKSTLLQVIAGAVMHSQGTIEYTEQNTKADGGTDDYKKMSIAAPYLELIEELTAIEMLNFHKGFKQLTLPIPEVLQIVQLSAAANKQIRYYSSGMKQRLKLAQAFFSNTPILLLDEPTTNLDADGIALYLDLIKNYTQNRLVIISSNDKMEYEFCEEVVRMGDYK
jgi:ABC-type multidrug transport system ATPase subunit